MLLRLPRAVKPDREVPISEEPDAVSDDALRQLR
jgi:hypothetical protein